MKNTALLFVFFFSIPCFGQFTRAVHRTESNQLSRSTVISRWNGDLTFITLKESKVDTLVLTSATMDEKGETSNYTTTELVLSGSYFAISGSGINSNNEIVLAILSRTGSINKLNHLTYNPASGTISSSSTVALEYAGGYVRSASFGNELITYLPMTNGEIRRIATDMNSTTTYSNTFFISGLTLSNSSLQWRKRTDLLIQSDGTELLSCQSLILKRSSGGVFSSINNPVFLNVYSTSIALNSQNQLLAINGPEYVLINTTNLTVIANDNLQNTMGTGYAFNELFARNNQWVYYMDPQGTAEGTKKIVFDGAMNITSTIDFNAPDLSIFSILEETNAHYLVGERINYNKNAVVVIKDVDDQSPGTFAEYHASYTHNNIRFQVGHLGSIFSNNYVNNNVDAAGFTYSHGGTYKPILYHASNSLMGTGASGDTVGIFSGYYIDDAQAGPFTPAQYDERVSEDRHNRGYYVDKAMITNHINYIASGVSNYTMPLGIELWPAHGDPSIGQAADIAAFEDVNANGIYEPALGDYPAIYGDRCILTVYHRKEQEGYVGNGEEGIECLQYIYVFDCDSNEAMMNTVFVNQKFRVYNSEINDAWIGTYTDPDIGNYSDDYVGTHVDLGMMYAYNGDLLDESNGGVTGFQNYLPALGVMTLRGARLTGDGIDNVNGIGVNESVNGFGFEDGSIDNEYLTLEASYAEFNGPPISSPTEYYSEFQGKDPSGAYQQSNGVDVRYSYFGDSDPQFYGSWGANHGNNFWEFTAGNPTNDRRIIGGTGPLDLTPNNPATDRFEISTAYIVAFDPNTPTTDIMQPLTKLFDYGYQLKQLYAVNDAGCYGQFNPPLLGTEKVELEAHLFPNPANSVVYIQAESNEIERVELFDASGRCVHASVENASSVQVDVHQLKSGIYFVQLTTPSGMIHSKFMKQ